MAYLFSNIEIRVQQASCWFVTWFSFSLLFTIQVNAQDMDQDNDGIPDIYEKGLGNLSFADAFNIQGVDNSAIAINDEEVQLTQDQRSQRGSAMSFGMIDLMDDFTFTIEAYFGVNRNQDLFSSSGADGIAIVFHNDPNGSFTIGVDGEGIGAQGIRNGLVLEIDTYGNGDTGANDPMRGSGDNHTDIWDSDDPERTSLMGGYRLFREGVESPLEDGTYHEVIFNWVTHTGTLSFTVDGIEAGALSLGSAESFINTYFAGSTAVHFGFTASTGAARNEHKVRILDMESLPLVLDTDNDGIYDHLDLDSDNDGIYDAVEAGHGADQNNGVVVGGDDNGDGIPDAVQVGAGFGEVAYELKDLDGDGIYNHRDLDADGDGCLDVAEMGFTDTDDNGILGTGIPVVDDKGVVVSELGYTLPNLSFLNPLVAGCLLATDLGDDGEGDDAYASFYEDDVPLDLMTDPQILNLENGIGTISIEFDGILDVGNEHIILGDQVIVLEYDSKSYSFAYYGLMLELSWVAPILSIAAVGEVGIPVEVMESVLDELHYHHADTLLPTGGERTMNIIIDDGINQSTSNWVKVMVEPINDLPVADPDTVTLSELNPIQIKVLEGDVDWDGQIDLSSLEIVTSTAQGNLTINNAGIVTYSPHGEISGNDTFIYTVQDNEGGKSNEATVIILLESKQENHAPIAADTSLVITNLDVISFSLMTLSLDSDGDPLAFELLGGMQHASGISEVRQNDVFSFTPNPGYIGSYTITYRVCDNQEPQLCDEGEINLIINEMDTDGDGIWDHNEDTNHDQNLANDDCDMDGLPNYLDEDLCNSGLLISSVVTNNGDDRNDFLTITGIEQYAKNRVIIFNRWGNKVWEVLGYNNSLNDRRFTGIGSRGTLPDGTYFYVINKGDNSPIIKGFITLQNY